MKKLISSLMVVVLVLTGCGWGGLPLRAAGAEGGQSVVQAPAASGGETVSSGAWLYYIDDRGHAVITGNTDASATTLTIPQTLEGAPVTGIQSGAFTQQASLTSLTIPTRVTQIGAGLFANPAQVRIRAYNGAAAHRWAAANGVRFVTQSFSHYEFRTETIDLTGEAAVIAIGKDTLTMPAALADIFSVDDVFYLPGRDQFQMDPTVGYVADVQVSGGQARVLYVEGNLLHAVTRLHASSENTPTQARIRWNPEVVEGVSGQWENALISEKDDGTLTPEKPVKKTVTLNKKDPKNNYVEVGLDISLTYNYDIEAGIKGKHKNVLGVNVPYPTGVYARVNQFDMTLNVNPYITAKLGASFDSGRKKLADVEFVSPAVISATAAVYVRFTASGQLTFEIEQVNRINLSWNTSRNKLDMYAESYVAKKQLRLDVSADLYLIPELAVGLPGIDLLVADCTIQFDFDAYAIVRRFSPLATCVDLKLYLHCYLSTIKFGIYCDEFDINIDLYKTSKKISLFSRQLLNMHLEDWKEVKKCQREAKNIKFETNGGTQIKEVKGIAWGTKYHVTNPTRKGYNFAGWYTDKGLTKSWKSGDDVYDNMTLYAKWTKKTTPAPNPGIPSGGGSSGGTGGGTTPPPTVTTPPAVTTPRPSPAPIPVAGVKLDRAEATLYTSGNTTVQLSGSVVPAHAENPNLVWKSSNPAVATVDDKGLVTAVTAGTATITCTSQSNPDASAQCKITVLQRVTGISIDKKEAALVTEMGSTTVQLTGTVSPANAAEKKVYWESSSPEIAHVDEKGLVTAIAPGKATITCAAADNTDIRTTCVITVTQPVSGIILSHGEESAYSISLLTGETVNLVAQPLPEDASDKTVRWSSGDEKVATVSDKGVVTAVGPGRTTIRATAGDGYGAWSECAIRVENQLEMNVTTVSTSFLRSGRPGGVVGYIVPTSNAMARMQSGGYELTYTLTRKGGGASKAELVPFETATTVDGASVRANGVTLSLTDILLAGTDTYTVTCKAGPYTELVTFEVSILGAEGEYAEAVTLKNTTFTIKAGQKVSIPATPIPITAGQVVPTGLTMTLIGSDRFDQNATVTATASGMDITFRQPGDYTATVEYAVNNIVYPVTLTFYVTDDGGMRHLPVESVGVAGKTSMLVGETQQLNCQVLPQDAYDRTVTWTSSNPEVAAVSATGEVKALTPGWVILSATANDGTGNAGTITVYVEGYLQLAEATTHITIYQDGESSLWVDGVQLTAASASRIAAASKSIVWGLERISGDAAEIALSEDDIASGGNTVVLGNRIHVLRINKPGTDRYTVTCSDGSQTVEGILILTVSDQALPTSVSLAKTTYEVDLNEAFELVTTPVCSPAGAKLPEGTDIGLDAPIHFWNNLTQNEGAEEGYTLALGTPGTYEIAVACTGANYTYTVPVTIRVRNAEGVVPVLPTAVTLNRQVATLLKGESLTLTATVEPANATGSTCTWSSGDPTVATVDAKGKVTAVSAGSTAISVTCPSSGVRSVCYLTVEEGLTLDEPASEITVYLEGLTRTKLTEIFLTDASSGRVTEKPVWTLTRVSGRTLTLRTEENIQETAEGITRYGCDLILYSVSKTGDTVYDLTCTAGKDSVTHRITVKSVSRGDSVPAVLTFKQTEYTAKVNELITVKPDMVCTPATAQLPGDVRIGCTMDDQTLAAMDQADYFLSRPMSTFSFALPGTYQIIFRYTHSNVVYSVPVTFRIQDENGNVPVQGTRVSLSAKELQLTPDETAKLTPVFTPADATNRQVTWASDNPWVATVAADGTVTAVGIGAATITCTPDDDRCAPAECYVVVEDAFSVESGADEFHYYLQGEKSNLLFNAMLTPGTIARIQQKGLTPAWTLSQSSGVHTQVRLTVAPDDLSATLETTDLLSGGADEYVLTCTAGSYQWSQTVHITVEDLQAKLPQSITIATPEVNLQVGQSATVDFTPICSPSGSALHADMWPTYVGFGGFYDALDRDVYKTDGAKVTVAFKEAGCYLLARTWQLGNLSYTALCRFNVGNAQSPALLHVTETEYTVYMNGKSAEVSQLQLTDSTFHQVLGSEVQWSAERLSGSSIQTGLKVDGHKVTLLALSAQTQGTDVWRVKCTFRGIEMHQDITIHAVDPRMNLPEDIHLAVTSASGTMGNPILLPLGVTCTPEGSALPDTGDDFWSLRMQNGLENAVSECKVENGMLHITFRESGYYSGALVYESGNIRFEKDVFFSVADEEDVVAKPENIRLCLLNAAATVYPEGEVNVPIAVAALSENLHSYWAGTIPAYAREKGIHWSVVIKTGSAATLKLRETEPGQAEVILSAIKGTGDVTFTITCVLDGRTYTIEYPLHVALKDEARPDPKLSHNAYTVTLGEGVVIDSQLYNGHGGAVLQSAGSWEADNALPAMNNEFQTYEGSWAATFYQAGTYATSVSGYVGNMKYELPLTIRVVDRDAAPAAARITLPAMVTQIEAEAFANLSVSIVDASKTKLRTIGKAAFSGCTELTDVYLPASVSSIANDAFSGCPEVVIHCTKGSYADTWARKQGLTVRYDMNE